MVERRYDDDGVSGSTMKRPALRDLLADVAAGKVDRIVVYRIDRWSWSLSDYFRLGEQLAAADVALGSISERIDTDSALVRFQLGLLLLMAQYERANAGERTAAKAQAAKAKGRCVGALPTGSRSRRTPTSRRRSARAERSHHRRRAGDREQLELTASRVGPTEP